MWKKWVLPPVARQDVHLAELPLPDATLEMAVHQGVRQAPEDEQLLMQVYVGWRLGEAGDIWFVWQHYEAPMPLPTPRARDCESLSLPALRLAPFSNFVDDLFSAWSSFFLCGKENLTKIWSLCPVGLGDWSIFLKCLMTWLAEITGKTSAEFKVLISSNLLELI